MPAYYNEIEPFAAEWLRRLIAAGHIAPGDVDERSIADVRPGDLAGYSQCHFFAGIGGWPLALRIAGWPDDRPVWTGSCPCQPFSVAGKGKGTADERHLWPAWFNLIRECRPPAVLGEQVAAAVGKGWLDGVFADLEGEGYACGAAIVPACAVDAPHRRDRLWFVADSGCGGWRQGSVSGSTGAWIEGAGGAVERGANDVADGDFAGLAERICLTGDDGAQRPAAERGGGNGALWPAMQHREKGGGEARQRASSQPSGPCSGYVVHDPSDGREEGRPQSELRSGWPASAVAGVSSDVGLTDGAGRNTGESATEIAGHGCSVVTAGGPWRRYVWITGANGKARRVGLRVRELADGVSAGVAGLRAAEEGTAPLQEAEIIPLLSVGGHARVGKLRAFGNAIVPQVAAEVIAAYMETLP